MFKDARLSAVTPRVEGYVPDRARGVASFRARCNGRHPVTAAAAIAATAAVRVTTPVPQAANAGGSFVDDFDLDEADARDEAMASLYGPSVVSRSHAPVLPTMSAPVVQSAVPVRTAQASSPAQQVRSQELRASRLPTTPAMRVCGGGACHPR